MRKDFAIGVVLAGLVYYSLWQCIETPRWAPILIPFAVVLLTLLWHRLYAVCRVAGYRIRETRRRRLSGVGTAPVPTVQDLIGETHHLGQWKFLPRAVDAQGRFFRDGVSVAFLPSIAILMLSAQVVLVGAAPVGLGLVIAESLVLGYLVLLLLTTHGPTGEWVSNRLRTELLRREQYLQLAQIGPYLRVADNVPDISVQRRALIEAGNEHGLRTFVQDQADTFMVWLNELNVAGAGLAIPNNTEERMRTYLYRRLRRQAEWFSDEIRNLHWQEKLWNSLLKVALVAALIVGVIHAVTLYEEMTTGKHSSYAMVVTFCGFLLPPFGAAILGIQKLYGFRERSSIYSMQLRSLRLLDAELETIIASVSGGSSHEGWRSFQRLALRVENSLALEMDQWLLLMGREEFEIAP